MTSIELVKVRKAYGPVTVVKELSLSVKNGEFIVIVGPSGCGKSTLLRMIAGLEPITEGDLFIDETRVNSLAPQARNIAMVFQTYALFPHMTVEENIAFGPIVRKESKLESAKKVARAAEVLNLSKFLKRKPNQLSGGQRQRVAMGRAIVRDPSVFLFDEPLSNLDAHLRVEMRTEIKALHHKLQSTIVYVTHDQIEAMTMADRIVIMNGGEIEQVGSPMDLYDRPKNVFVAGFLGSPSMVFFMGEYSRTKRLTEIVLQDGSHIAVNDVGLGTGSKIIAGIRPFSFQLDKKGPLELAVEVVEPTGSETHVTGIMAQQTVRCVFRERQTIDPGDKLRLMVSKDDIHIFDARTELRL